METKHTAGQWEARDTETQKPFVSTVNKNGATDFIAFIDTNYKNDGEAEANAKLIAAAPELLQALILAYSMMVIDTNYQGRNILETIRTAIKAATT
jgi:hypothetical protein